MFLTVKDYTIPDFLSALGFIAPKGMSVDYILAPDTLQPEAQNQIEAEGFTEQPALNLTNVKYLKKDLKQTHSFSPKANQIEDPNLLPPEMPKAAPVPMDMNLGNNNQIMTPKRGIIIAECTDTDFEKSFILRENFCGIPRNTMVVFHEENENRMTTKFRESASSYIEKVIKAAENNNFLKEMGLTNIKSTYSNEVTFLEPGDKAYDPSGDYITLRHATPELLEKHPSWNAWTASVSLNGIPTYQIELKTEDGDYLPLDGDVIESLIREIKNISTF